MLVTFIDVDDIQTEASRDSKGIVIAGNHVFKENTYAIQLYATPDSIAGKSTSQGDIDAEGFIQEVVFSHPGSAQEIREFKANWINRNIMIIVEHCSDGSKDQYGASCAPLRMKSEAVDDKDKNTSTLTFSSALKGPEVAIYQGTITLSGPVDTVPLNATTIDLSAGPGEYQLSDNNQVTVITACSNAVDGMVFTLLGSGGEEPATITKANDFLLASGTTWTGLSNSRITFRAFKSDSAAWKFIEQSRS